MNENHANGRIEMLIGPMFSGKTAQLIFRVTQAQAVGRKVQVFKPRLDTRGPSHEVQSCTGLHIEAMPVGDATDILKLLDPNTNVVALDEAQFFDPAVVNACRALADRGKRVIVAGLDMDFRGEPFGPTPQLLAVAEVVHKLTALCAVCGEPASYVCQPKSDPHDSRKVTHFGLWGGHDDKIKEYLLGLFRRAGLPVEKGTFRFDRIHRGGKKPPAHDKAYYTFQGKMEPDKVITVEELLREAK